jgi:hypothetical protein
MQKNNNIVLYLIIIIGVLVIIVYNISKPKSPETQADVLPTTIGQCSNTKISEIGTRLTDGTTGHSIAGSGSYIAYSNGGKQVSYDTIQGIENSQVGDRVILCLISIPEDCPPNDDRGKNYTATNLRTGEAWRAQDSSHSCGGA